MDKYQLNLINRTVFEVKESSASFKIDESGAYATQPENAYIETIEVSATNASLKSVIVDGVASDASNGVVKFCISFKDDSKSLTLCFNNGVVDDCTLPITLQKTSKAAWDKKVEDENRTDLINRVNVAVNAGTDLLNVLFTLVKDAQYAIAELYYGDRKMGQFRNDDGQSYISIGGLAFGTYTVVVSLYDSDGHLIVKADPKDVALKPTTPDLKSIEEKLEGIRRLM